MKSLPESRPMTRLIVYRTKSLRPSQRWAWKLVAANGRSIAVSGEGYRDRGDATEMGEAIATGSYAPKEPTHQED